MRTIICDLCKKELGKTVNVGMYSISTAEFSPNSFWNDNSSVFNENRTVDICSECSNKICEAQNEAVKNIRNTNVQKQSK